MKHKMRSAALGFALNIYNALIFVIMNVVMWQNHIWNKSKWTKVKADS